MIDKCLRNVNKKAQHLARLLGKTVTLGDVAYDPEIVISPSRHIQVSDYGYFLVVDEDGVYAYTPMTRKDLLSYYGPAV